MAHQPFGPRGWTPDLLGPLSGKTYLITGANSGAGFQAARLLLTKGGNVVMLNRSEEKSRSAIAALKQELGADAPVSFIRMDLSQLSSVREAVVEILASVPKIDALICNAAIAQVPKRRLTVDGYESQFGVNHLAHFLLCGLLFERLENEHGRIVMVGSGGYRMGLKRIQFEDINFDKDYTAWNAYAQSKLAQMMFGYELQRRIQANGISVEVHVCHPGASRTSLIDNSASRFNKIIWSILSRIIAQSAERGAWPEVMCATYDGLEARTLYGPTRRGETVGPVGCCKLDPCALDRESALRLWSLSEQLTALEWPL